MDMQSEISEFYKGKSILITGCTGFIGKSLIWKLLYSCPSIKTIYLLIRKKYGKSISERRNELFSFPIFDNFRQSNPDIFEKVVIIEGDLSEENNGISEKDKIIILNEVSIIFHNAALLKMDASLREAINVNTKGTIRLLDIALEMKKLVAFVHVSTAYSCCEENVNTVEEKLYSISKNPYEIISTVDSKFNIFLEKFKKEIIAPLPNTYTYSKRLAEQILRTYEDKFLIIVARPTIVLPSIREPIPGWIDNLNGLSGICVATGKGLLHSFFANVDGEGDFVPVDIVCNSLIAMPWAEIKKKGLHSKDTKISVYNVALTEHKPITWRDLQENGSKAFLVYPFETILWYPTNYLFQGNLLIHKFEGFFYHTIPAYVIDCILYVLGKKTFLVRVQKKISAGLDLFRYFGTHQWKFQTDNIMMLKNVMNDADKDVFPVTEKDMDLEALVERAVYIFDNFRKSNPDIFEKVAIIEGDLSEENNGISEKDKITILNEVSIIFHNAALLKMDASLREAINVNTKGTIRLLDIALEMKKLVAFVHVSTAYSCCEENVNTVEEKLYSISKNPYEIISTVDSKFNIFLEKFKKEIIAPLPNTYIYSKRLAEQILRTYEDKFLIIVARPTIVCPSIREPIPGWIDNLNGPSGIAVATAKGLLHSFFANVDSEGDFVPVDIVCNSLIAMPWAEIKKKGLHSKDTKMSVYNVALTEHKPITWRDVQETSTKASLVYPFETILWYPTYNLIQENLFIHKLERFFYHTIPAYVIDCILYVLGKKTFLVRVQKKISAGLDLSRYFTTHQWKFQTDNIMMLKNVMNDADKEVFPVTEKDMDIEALVERGLYVFKKYYFQENMDNIEWCRTKLKM
ncbi:hypothetical protein V9T40_013036 [Parthenolecanium corni]|uniref:Fatty acyl-CoA reductase n=1 Tax=Parthenolecanium corni TaxID=536013 RepID=A0AAN9Y103_9HEMI